MGLNLFKLFAGLVLFGLGLFTPFKFLAVPGAALIIESLFHQHLRLTAQSSANTKNKPPVIYGKARVGAVELDSRQDSSENLHFVGALCHGSQNGEGVEDFHTGEIDGILWIEDNSPDLRPDGGLITGQPYITDFFDQDSDYGRHDGSVTQPVDKTMNAAFATEWPTTSRLAGVAYVVGKFEHAGLEDGVFAGFPQISMLVSGNKVKDTRTGTWAWSDNSALCIYDLLTSPVYGAGVLTSRISTADFDTAADICDETVTHPDGTRKRYTCNGVIDTNLPLSRRFDMLLSSCNGNLIEQAGVFRLVIRQAQSAESFTADEDMVVGNIAWRKPGIKDTGNQILATFVNAGNDYQLDTVEWPEAGSTDALTFLTEDDDRPAPFPIDLPFTTNQYTALDIASILLKELRNGDAITFVSREQAIKFQIGDVVTVDHPLLGADAPMDAWIIAMQPAHDRGGRVQLRCLEYHAAAYTLPTHSTITQPPAGAPPDRTKKGAVSGLSVSCVFVCSAPTVPSVILRATWTGPSLGLLRYIVEYRVSGSSTWIGAPSTLNTTTDIVLASVDGQTYEVGITFQSIHRVKSTQATATVDLATCRTNPDGSQITAPDITITQDGGAVRADIVTTSSNGTVIDINASTSTGFTPSSANLVGQAFIGVGNAALVLFTPPGPTGGTVYYKVGVSDCLSDAIGEAISYSAEFSFVYSGAAGTGINFTDNVLSTTTGTVDIDWTDGWVVTVTPTGNITFTFSGYTNGNVLQVLIDNTGGHTITWPAVEWHGGLTPVQTTGEDSYTFTAKGATIGTVRGQQIATSYA